MHARIPRNGALTDVDTSSKLDDQLLIRVWIGRNPAGSMLGAEFVQQGTDGMILHPLQKRGILDVGWNNPLAGIQFPLVDRLEIPGNLGFIKDWCVA